MPNAPVLLSEPPPESERHAPDNATTNSSKGNQEWTNSTVNIIRKTEELNIMENDGFEMSPTSGAPGFNNDRKGARAQ